MKTFLVIVVVLVGGWLAWHYWLGNTNNTTAIATQSPSATLPGVGGEGTQPPGYTDQGSVDIGTTSPTPMTTVKASTPRPTVRYTPRPTVRPTPSASPSPASVLAFRNVEAMNGSSESGVLLISTAPNGYSQLNFNVNGSPAGTSQPTYIYRGASCQGSDQIAWGLNPTVNGSTMTIIPVTPADLLAAGNLYVVIQESTNNTTRVSCAKI